MQRENLNLQYHYKRMLLKALNITDTKKQAAKKLNVSFTTLAKWTKQFNIEYDKRTQQYAELAKN